MKSKIEENRKKEVEYLARQIEELAKRCIGHSDWHAESFWRTVEKFAWEGKEVNSANSVPSMNSFFEDLEEALGQVKFNLVTYANESIKEEAANQRSEIMSKHAHIVPSKLKTALES